MSNTYVMGRKLPSDFLVRNFNFGGGSRSHGPPLATCQVADNEMLKCRQFGTHIQI